MMKKQKLATLLGCFAGITLIAYASSTACNKIIVVACAPDPDSVYLNQISSPNCISALKYDTTIVCTGSVKALTAATAAGTGYSAWNESPQKCTYVRQIIRDCKGLSPQVVVEGDRGDYLRAEGAQRCP
jgi:hypothetical protein